MTKTAQKVFVGLSGGVDSSVAALRLLQQGYDVTGVFIKVWHPDWLECNWEQERLDAMRIAAKLGIPFLTCDAEEDYKNEVGEYFIAEYKAGRTPNPDVMCNQHVKFGAFLRFAKQHGADYVATGHYAQVKKEDEVYKLYRGVDESKDQSYFLWTLTQEELRQVLFPVGNTTKAEIRREAEKADLPTAVKKDSQGICFLGPVDIPEFMSHFTTLVEGPVLDVHGGRIGTHQGALVYTLGQRHGFNIETPNIARQPHYVVAKDIETNTLVVDTKPPTLSLGSTIDLEKINWISGMSVTGHVEAQIRYRQKPFMVEVVDAGGGEAAARITTDATEKPSAGQSMVFYHAKECLGGAVVK